MKPQDLVVAAKLLTAGYEASQSFASLGQALGLSASEAHACVRRLVQSGLVDRDTRAIRRTALLEFVVHGLKYVFPPEWKPLTRGVPTSYAAPPLRDAIAAGENPPVWPFAEGTVRGEGLVPLYPSVPQASTRDPELHEWLALFDAVRAGRGRERKLAVDELTRRLSP